MNENLKETVSFDFKHYNSNNGIDKISRYDRFVDNSFELTIEDTERIKVDRIDRM